MTSCCTSCGNQLGFFQRLRGFLTITSHRGVFTGVRRSIEMPYSKLLSVNVFQDGVQFHLSNRKNPPLFRLESGVPDSVAAAVTAACQHELV